jgi:choline-sulfatase
MFLVISFPHPHPPLNPPEPYASRYDDADAAVPNQSMAVNDGLPEPFRAALRGGTPQYGGWRVAEHGEARLRARLTEVRALVGQIDDTIGRLLEGFAWGRTVVAFTSDHGDFAGHRGLAGKVPWIPFDDLVRVPLILAGAGIASGREITSVVQSCDLALTFCDLAGLPPPAPVEQFDSSSLAPFLAPGAMPGDPDRIALFLANPGWPGGRRRSLKLIWDPPSDARVLFDLDDDPDELVDVSGDPAYGAELAELDCAVRTAMAREPPQFFS